MKDITDRVTFRPRIYNGIFRVNIFCGKAYLGTIRDEGKTIDRESGAPGFVIEEESGLFYVYKDKD